MKSISKLIIFVFAVVALSASAYAQSPGEQLKQMVEQLQKTPNDNALRERVIRLAQTLKPPPDVPDEALRREGRAKFAFKNAKSNADYLSAAGEYEEAVRVAPWIPGYYADLCTIYEKAEKYAEARRNCEFAMAGASDRSQVAEMKQRIAGLEFGIEKAAKAEPARPAPAATPKSAIVGIWRGAAEFDDTDCLDITRQDDAFGLQVCNSPFPIYVRDVRITETTVKFVRLIRGEPALSYDLRIQGSDLVGIQTNLFNRETYPARYVRKP